MRRLLVLIPFMAGCLAADSYDMVIDWQTAGASNEAVTAEVSYDGTSGKTYGYTGTMRIAGETFQPTIHVCVEAQRYELVYDETIYCNECSDYEWVALTVPQCKDVRIDETHVMFDLVLAR